MLKRFTRLQDRSDKFSVRPLVWIFIQGVIQGVISSQKTVREGAVDSVRGVEAAIELYKDPEYGTGRSQLGLFFFRQDFRITPYINYAYSSLFNKTIAETMELL